MSESYQDCITRSSAGHTHAHYTPPLHVTTQAAPQMRLACASTNSQHLPPNRPCTANTPQYNVVFEGNEKLLLKKRAGWREQVPIFVGIVLAFCLTSIVNLGLYSVNFGMFFINDSALVFLSMVVVVFGVPFVLVKFNGSIKMWMWMLWWLLKELAVSFFENLRAMLAALPVLGKCCGGPDHMDDYDVVQILEDFTEKLKKRERDAKDARQAAIDARGGSGGSNYSNDSHGGVHYSRDGSDVYQGRGVPIQNLYGEGKDAAIPLDFTHYIRFDQMRSAISTKLRAGKNFVMTEDDIDKEVRHKERVEVWE